MKTSIYSGALFSLNTVIRFHRYLCWQVSPSCVPHFLSFGDLGGFQNSVHPLPLLKTQQFYAFPCRQLISASCHLLCLERPCVSPSLADSSLAPCRFCLLRETFLRFCKSTYSLLHFCFPCVLNLSLLQHLIVSALTQSCLQMYGSVSPLCNFPKGRTISYSELYPLQSLAQHLANNRYSKCPTT